MWFDKFADWISQQNFVLIGLIILLAAFLAGALLKTAWGIWDKRR